MLVNVLLDKNIISIDIAKIINNIFIKIKKYVTINFYIMTRE
ncbi:hypothetical protein CLOBAR_00800 [Intestinibacter bartlettii DSM 16795]|nr:hypothetical protein CLOBAR_00800 [Intestinibacter bartlettii DSM 16795]